MHNEHVKIFENGISFDVTPRPSLERETVVATFVDGNSERHKIALNGVEMLMVREQLLERIKSENIPFMNHATLYINPSNPIYVIVKSRQVFAPPSTVSPFASQGYLPSV